MKYAWMHDLCMNIKDLAICLPTNTEAALPPPIGVIIILKSSGKNGGNNDFSTRT